MRRWLTLPFDSITKVEKVSGWGRSLALLEAPALPLVIGTPRRSGVLISLDSGLHRTILVWIEKPDELAAELSRRCKPAERGNAE